MTLTDERRLVTALFADLVGFTGRAESSDPEAVRDLQQRYFAAVAAEVERFGGSLEKYIGDAVLALFGAPTAHDDDAERALRAALGIRNAVTGLHDGLQVRIGVNTGEVVGGLGSGPHAGEYTVSGDAVNVAARLQQAAEPNQILVGSPTRRLSAEAFAFSPASELSLKGRAEPVEAWRLERALPERPRLRGGEASLVGRTRERAMLESALEEAAAGRGLMVAVVGEPGIGKSRLALELRRHAEATGFASAWATARSYATAFPYYMVAQLVGHVLARTQQPDAAAALDALGVRADGDALERWAAVLDGVVSESEGDDPRLAGVSPAGRQRMLVQAVIALLRGASTREPLFVVLDDVHWADPASLAVVEEVLDVVAEMPVAIVGLYRSGWSHGWEGKSSYQQLNLRALLPDEARRLAAELAPGGASAEFTERVLERSAGNPLFLEELLHGEDETAGGSGHRLPETIHEMLLARLDALPPAARQALQLASVVGMEFSEPMLHALAAEPGPTEGGGGRAEADEAEGGIDDALRRLQRAELIVPRPSDAEARAFAIRHPLIHEVAYRSLLQRTRRELHGRIARWLEEQAGDERVAELAHHYSESDQPNKARHYLPLAGQRAERLNAGWEARDWYLQAADAFADDALRQAEMLEAAARQAYLIGINEESMALQEQAIALYQEATADVPALNARAALGRYKWLHGDPVAAEREISLAIEGLERLPPTPELAYAYSSRSQILMLRPDFPRGEVWARKAIAIAEETGATLALAHAHNNLGLSLAGMGDPTGMDHLRRSLELCLEHNLIDDAGRAYVNMLFEGSRIMPFGYEGAEELIGEALDFAQRTIPGGVFDQWIRQAHAEFLFISSRWEEAERAVASVDWARSGAYNEVQGSAMPAHMAAYRGRYDDALALASSKRELALRIGDQQAVLPILVAQAQGEMGLGNEAGAVAAMRQAVERPLATSEVSLASWFVFEAADLLTMALRRPDPEASPDRAAIGDGLALVARFAADLEPAVLLGGEAAIVDVRRALFGAAVEQLVVLGAEIDAPPLRVEAGFPGREEAARTLDGYHRLFDAARIRLWLAEERSDAGLAADARAVFADLGAHPFVERASRLARLADRPS